MMNKDLEIIKKNIKEITDSEGYDYWDELGEKAIAAAERMASEIRDLRITKSELIAENEQLRVTVDRLKAELEKRPDVIYCKDCVNRFSEDACAIDKEKHFCSFGQRKSEEGK